MFIFGCTAISGGAPFLFKKCPTHYYRAFLCTYARAHIHTRHVRENLTRIPKSLLHLLQTSTMLIIRYLSIITTISKLTTIFYNLLPISLKSFNASTNLFCRTFCRNYKTLYINKIYRFFKFVEGVEAKIIYVCVRVYLLTKISS